MKISLPLFAALLAAPLSQAGITQNLPVINLPVPAQTAPARYGSTPLSFEQNQGQADPSVRFLAHGSGYTTLLEPTSATLLLESPDVSRPKGAGLHEARTIVRMRLIGATHTARMTGIEPLPGYVNYLSGVDRSTWATGLPTYAATDVHGVYPGVDLKYYGTSRRLEYDFVVAPHAQPSTIRLAIDGAHPSLQGNGELRLQAGHTANAADIVFRKPVMYQQVDGRRLAVSGSFAVDRQGQVGFKVGSYDHDRALIIDPVVSYASYFGGTGNDAIQGSALNAAAQLYAVGQTISTSLPGATGEFQAARIAGKNLNNHDAFVTKFSADGSSIIWTTYLAGDGDDGATAVAVNASDQAYVVGNTNSCGPPATTTSFPFTSDALQTLCNPNVVGFNSTETSSGGYDVFLVKLSADGKTLLYGTPLGGSNNDFASSVALDAAGKVYIVGETQSTQYLYAVSSNLSDVPSYPVNNHGAAAIGTANYPTTANAFYTNTTESKKYATTDSNGNVTGPADEQAFLTVLSADLHTNLYSTLIGGGILGGCGNGDCNTNGLAIAVNSSGIAFIGGNTSSAHWPTTAGSFAPKCSNAGAANSQCPMTGWLAAFDPTKTSAASLIFSTYITGTSAGTNGTTPLYPGSDVYGLATDSTGNVVITGDTNANDFPTTAGVLQPACVLSSDGNGDSNVCANAYVTKLSPTGATVWSTYYHGTAAFSGGNSVVGQGVALDAANNVYVVGLANVPSIPLLNPISTNAASNSDAFLFVLSPDAKTLLMGTYLGSGGGIALDGNSLHLDSSNNAYFSGSQAPNPYGGTSFPTTTGAFDTAIQGSDGWVVKMSTLSQTSATTLSVAPSSAAPGASIVFTATVAGTAGDPAPTGTVTFNNGATALGSATLAATGVATFTTTALTAGTYSVVASYAGDGLYSASASAAQMLTVVVPTPAPTVTIGASPASVVLGAASTLTWSSTNATACTASGAWSGTQAVSGSATETPAAAGTASYTLTCTGAGGSGNATATVTVAAAAAATPPASTSSHGGGGGLDLWALAGLIGLGLARAGRLARGQ